MCISLILSTIKEGALYMRIIYLGYPVPKKNAEKHVWSIADNNIENGIIEQLTKRFGANNIYIISLDMSYLTTNNNIFFNKTKYFLNSFIKKYIIISCQITHI